jgi:hypothetical protein
VSHHLSARESVRTIITTTDRRRALKTACVAAGLDPLELEWPQS